MEESNSLPSIVTILGKDIGKEYDVEFPAYFAEMVVGQYLAKMKSLGVENALEYRFDYDLLPEGWDGITVTVQAYKGKTPLQLLAEAREEIAKLRNENKYLEKEIQRIEESNHWLDHKSNK